MAVCYLITTKDKEEQFQKIGRTNHLKRRFSSLQTGSSTALVVYSQISSNRPDVLEQLLHQQYDSYRRLGEWFQLPESELKKWYPYGYVDFDTKNNISLISDWIQKIIISPVDNQKGS